MATPHTEHDKDAFVLSHAETLHEIESQSPPIEVNSHWQIVSDGVVLRHIRILAPHPDGGYIFIDLPSKLIRRDLGILGICPEYNLRRIFRPVND